MAAVRANNAAIDLLGLRAKDQVTGFAGTVTSVSFDLYGCVQVVRQPSVDKDGQPGEGRWFDVNRLVVEQTRVMPVPDFSVALAQPTDYAKGPAEKSLPSRGH